MALWWPLWWWRQLLNLSNIDVSSLHTVFNVRKHCSLYFVSSMCTCLAHKKDAGVEINGIVMYSVQRYRAAVCVCERESVCIISGGDPVNESRPSAGKSLKCHKAYSLHRGHVGTARQARGRWPTTLTLRLSTRLSGTTRPMSHASVPYKLLYIYQHQWVPI